MVSLLSKFAIVGVVLIAVAYQTIFKHLIFDILGYGRELKSITAFSHAKCVKIDELGLEGCEDMWLHDETGYLYMACSDSRSRVGWLPAVDHLNASSRSLTDRIAVLDTRAPGALRDRIQWLTIENFSGINGDSTLNLHGLDIWVDESSSSGTTTLKILLNNHRPPLDPITGAALDATKVGANSTIELFVTEPGSGSMKHVRTYADPLIQTPNRVAWVNDHAFVFSNDHSSKVGLRRALDPVLGGGNVVYCSSTACNIAFSSGFNMPNGLTMGKDGLIYVPSTTGGYIDVFSIGTLSSSQGHTLKALNTEPHHLHHLTRLSTLPIDNLRPDADGDIYAAAFPACHKWIESEMDPFGVHPPSAVLRIRAGEGEGGYVVETVLEDNGSVLPGSTVAVHDAQTGRIFLGGAMAPWISICETR